MLKFWIIAFIVAIAVQAFVMYHIWQLLPFNQLAKSAVMVLMLIAWSCLFLQFFSDSFPLSLATAIYEIGNSWLVIVFYLMMLFLLLDAGRLLHLVPSELLHHNRWLTAIITILMLSVFVAGNLHYHHKVRRELNLTSSKPLSKPLRLVMVSDLHAGYHNRPDELARWVDLINAESPDLVLMAGDVIDGNIRPLVAFDADTVFHRIKAPVYACLGNHEYIAGVNQSLAFLRKAGIQVLRDSSVDIGEVTIVGRDDRSNPHRKPLDQLVSLAPSSHFLILLDHQPYHLEQAERCNVDLQLSGHTHHGQVWPLNLITKAIYECDFGFWRRGRSQYYISSGLGLWGGKFRIGTSSEFVVINISSD